MADAATYSTAQQVDVLFSLLPTDNDVLRKGVKITLCALGAHERGSVVVKTEKDPYAGTETVLIHPRKPDTRIIITSSEEKLIKRNIGTSVYEELCGFADDPPKLLKEPDGTGDPASLISGVFSLLPACNKGLEMGVMAVLAGLAIDSLTSGKVNVEVVYMNAPPPFGTAKIKEIIFSDSSKPDVKVALQRQDIRAFRRNIKAADYRKLKNVAVGSPVSASPIMESAEGDALSDPRNRGVSG